MRSSVSCWWPGNTKFSLAEAAEEEVAAEAEAEVVVEAECGRAADFRRPAECRGRLVRAWAHDRVRAGERDRVPARECGPVRAYQQVLDLAADPRLVLVRQAAHQEAESLKAARDRAVDYQEGLVPDSARALVAPAMSRAVGRALAN